MPKSDRWSQSRSQLCTWSKTVSSRTRDGRGDRRSPAAQDNETDRRRLIRGRSAAGTAIGQVGRSARIRPLPTTWKAHFPTQRPHRPPSRRSRPRPAGHRHGEATIRMPLREIVQRAVANNLDVKVAGYDPAIDETRVTEAEARFDPTFFTNSNTASIAFSGRTPTIRLVDHGSSQTDFRTYTHPNRHQAGFGSRRKGRSSNGLLPTPTVARASIRLRARSTHSGRAISRCRSPSPCFAISAPM